MIESAHNALLKRCRRLLVPRTRKKERALLLEGPRSLADALTAGIAIEAVLLRGEACAADVEAVVDRAHAAGARIEWVEAKLFRELVDTVTAPDLVAIAAEPAWEREALLGQLTRERPLAVLCAIQDPGNLGAALRTARGLGFGGALLTHGTTDVYAPKVVRAAAATLLAFPVFRGGPAREELELLRAAGVTTVALGGPGEGPDEVRRALSAAGKPFALLLGNEGNGLDRNVMRNADHRLWIPLAEGVESLNAHAAFAVAGFALRP